MIWLWLLACAKKDADVEPPETDTDTDTDSDSDSDTDTDTDTDTDLDPCASYTAQATAGELAATPRSDANLELLALTMTPDFTARQAVYDRVVTDVAAIRSLEPALASIAHFPAHDGKTLLLGAPPGVLTQMEAGTYTDWACPNAAYGMVQVTNHGSWAEVAFEGLYDLKALAAEYGQLPAVDYAEPNSVIGDGPTLCGTVVGTTYHYVFDDAWGDCPSGCISHTYWYVTTESGGAITFVETWSTEDGTPAPSWVGSYAQC